MTAGEKNCLPDPGLVWGPWKCLPEKLLIHVPTGMAVVAELHLGYRGGDTLDDSLNKVMAPLLRAWRREKPRGLVIWWTSPEKNFSRRSTTGLSATSWRWWVWCRVTGMGAPWQVACHFFLMVLVWGPTGSAMPSSRAYRCYCTPTNTRWFTCLPRHLVFCWGITGSFCPHTMTDWPGETFSGAGTAPTWTNSTAWHWLTESCKCWVRFRGLRAWMQGNLV